MDEDSDPFLEYDKDDKCLNAVDNQELAGAQEEGAQSSSRSSPIFNTPNIRFNSNHIRRRSRIRKSTSDLPLGCLSLPLVGQSLENLRGPPTSPENLFFSQQLETVPIAHETSVNEVLMEASSPHRSDSEEDIFVSLPSTAYSQQIIPSAINDLISGPQPADVSWTSSMATPLASNVTYSNLNTEERKVFLPSEDCGVAVKPRALFSPDDNETDDCDLMNISTDADYLQNIHGEKFLKTPKFIKKIDSKACFESPLATDVNQECTSSPMLKFNKHINDISRGSPILSGSSDFKRTPNHNLIQGDGDLFDIADETDHLPSHHTGSKNDCSAESTPNVGIRRKSPQIVSQTPTPEKQELHNTESFLQDISVTALEEVCKEQELKNALQSSSSTPEKEKQHDAKRKRLLFSSNPAASNSFKAVFKTPETKAKKEEIICAQVSSVDDVIPDDSFMEHLAAMNTSIFSEEFQPTSKVQSIKSSASQMKKFSYSVDQQTDTNLDDSLTKAEPKTLMKEILSSVLALESCSAPNNTKNRTVKSSGDLVVFSQLLGEMNEVASGAKIENGSLSNVGHSEHKIIHTVSSPLPSVGFQTANGNQITLSQEAIDKGLSVLKEAMEDIQPPSDDMLQPIPPASVAYFKEQAAVPSKTEKIVAKLLPSTFDDNQVEEEVKELLKLVSDGEDFHPWHEIEQPGCSKPEEELEIKSSTGGHETSKCSLTSADQYKNDVTKNVMSDSSSHGFCTANGKSILISEDKLAKAEKLLCEADDELINQKSVSDESPHQQAIQKLACNFDRKRRSATVRDCDYTTDNKRVCLENVSCASKKNSEQKSKMPSSSAVDSCGVNAKSVIHETKIGGINIGEEALNVINNLFRIKKPFSPNSEIKISEGFSTASGRAVNISQNALSKAESLFCDIPVEEVCQGQFKKPKIAQDTSKLGSCGTASPMKKEINNAVEGAGFLTARGKKVTVSETSLARVKNLFNDISAEATDSNDSHSNNKDSGSTASITEEKLTMSDQTIKKEKDQLDCLALKGENTKNSTSLGFSTASGKNVVVSKESLNKVRNLFDDIPAQSGFDTEHSIPESSGPSDLWKDQNYAARTHKSFTPVSKQFKKTCPSLTNRRSLQVSEQPKNVFKETVGTVPFSVKAGKDSSSTKGFSTASGKTVNVSKQALDKVKNIFSESDLEIESIANNDYESTHSRNHLPDDCNSSSMDGMVQGFSTASGRSVSVSTEALNKVKGLFNEEFLPPGYLEFEGKAPLCDTKTKSSNFATSKHGENAEADLTGFLTAGGKAVQVSKEAITKARNIFDDLPHESMSETNKGISFLNNSAGRSEIQTQNSTDYKMVGFSTAGGKSVHISKQALSKAQVLFENLPSGSATDTEEEISLIENRNKPSGNHLTSATNCTDFSTEMVGFSTAAGKAVKISKEALEKAQNLLDKSLSETLDSALLKTSVPAEPKNSSNNPFGFSCFSTAGGKSVPISMDALRKAENLFEELPLQTINTAEADTLPAFNRKFNTINSVSDDSGVGLSDFSISKSLTSKTSLANILDVSCFPSNNKENQNVNFNQDSKLNTSAEITRSSLTQEITASTAAFLADDEFFDEAESLDVAANAMRTIKTSPSMVSDRLNSLKPIISAAPENKYQPPEPTSPILVRSDSIGSRRRTRKGRLSLSSNSSVKSPTLSRQSVVSEHCHKSGYSLPPKMNSAGTSPHANSALNRGKSIHRNASSLCNSDLTRTLCDKSDPKETSKLPPSRKLFDHEDISSTELDTPNAKSIGIAPLRDSTVTPISTCNNKISHVNKPLHQAPLIKRTLTRNLSSASGFKTPYKTTNNKEPLKRSPSSPAQNQPEAKKMKPSTNLYVSHILSPLIESTDSGSRNIRPEVAEMRRRAAEEQKQLVENFAELKGKLLKPRVGTWFANRSGEKPIKMVDFGQPSNFFSNELIEIGLRPAALFINADTSAEFRFSAWDYYSEDMCKENVAGLPVGDGALLVLDSQGTAGVVEFERAFLASPGVDPSLVPSGWVKNHYRWIVWKLAALERTFPYQLGKRCLLPHSLMLQLKYRYDREIDRCQRSALHRILEHDDSAAKRIVFCVAGVIGEEDSNRQVELELTDGWYSVMATIDLDMQHRVRKGMIKVGTKLITHGAELLNCSEGCSPLQALADIRLKLCSNSTRRARWHTKLGFQDNPGPIKIALGSILSSGGTVSCFSGYVARVYPIIYMEKTAEKTVMRSQRAESKEMTKSERKRQQLAEVVYSQVQNELQIEQSKKKPKSLKCSLKSLSSITSGEELSDILESSADPLSVQCMLSEEQKGIIADYQRFRQEELRSEMEARVRSRLEGKSDKERQVTAILKVRLLDISNMSCSAILSVWRPSEDVSSVFKEGQKITIFGAAANGLRCGDLQLSASRSTRYHVDNPSDIRSDLLRTVFPLDLSSQNITVPRFGELDIVGIVIRITPAPQTPGNTTHFQTVYVSDSEQNIIGISFWEGIKMFAVEDLLAPRALIAVSNLQWRAGSGNRAIPTVYVSEFSFFTANPKPAYLQTALQNLRRSLPNDIKMFCKACEDKLDRIISSPAGCPRTPVAVQSSSMLRDQNTFASSPAVHHQNHQNISSEVAVKAQQRLAVDSQLDSPSSAGISPAVEKRIAKLEKYGEAPPISPILICQPRRSLKKAFKAPRRTDSSSSLGCKEKD